MVGRKVGREPLDADDDPEDVHAWTIDDAARSMLAALGDAAGPSVTSTATATPPSAAVSCALPYLPLGDRADLVDDAIRTNDTRIVAAALGRMRPRTWTTAYDQAILKCVFVGVPIALLDGLPDGSRRTARGCSRRSCTSASPPAEMSRRRSGS